MTRKKKRKPNKLAGRSTGRNPAGVRIVASTLAEELSAVLDLDEAESEEYLMFAICVGQWLADQGRPGRWDRLDLEALMQGMVPVDERERQKYLFMLASLLGYAGLQSYIPADTGTRYLAEIRELTQGRSPVDGFINQTRALLQALTEGPPAPAIGDTN